MRNERIFAFAEPWTRRSLFAIIKEIRPNAQLAPETEDSSRDLSEVAERPRALKLLKWYGQDGFTSLRKSVVDTIETYDKSLVL